MATKVLVTGGAGFIGSHLVRGLLDAGREVRVVDNLSTGTRANLYGLDVELLERDLACDPIEGLCDGIDAVFHLAALGSVPRSVNDPVATHAACATATLRMLVLARDAGVRRFVNTSSSSVYGDVENPPMREEMRTMPRSPYAVAKLAAEQYTRVFASLYGMSTVSLRLFNVFGPRQDASSGYAAAIPRFISAYLQQTSPTIYGSGQQSRDFKFVANVVRAFVLAADAPRLAGESVNIAAGRPHSVLEILDLIAGGLGPGAPPIFAPERSGDLRDSHADVTLARELLGFEATVSVAQGLQPTIAALRQTVPGSSSPD